MSGNWEDTTLGFVLDRVRRKIRVEDGKSYPAIGVAKSGQGLIRKEPFIGGVSKYKVLYEVQEHDVVLRTITAFESPVGVADRNYDRHHVSGVFFTYLVRDSVNPLFLRLFFQSGKFWREMENRATGTVLRRKTISDSAFAAIPISLPPRPVQDRIVALFESIDRQISALQNEHEASQRLIAGVLSMETFGCESWPRLPFTEAIDLREGPGILARDFREDGVPLIRLAGLSSGTSLLSKCNYLDPTKVDQRWSHFRVEVGDVLLSTSASLGRVAVVTKEAAGAIPYTGIIRMRPASARIKAAYIPWLLRSRDFVRQIESAGVGTTMAHFGPSHLRRMSVAVPDPEVQIEISRVLEALSHSSLAIRDEADALREVRNATLNAALNRELDVAESLGEPRLKKVTV